MKFIIVDGAPPIDQYDGYPGEESSSPIHQVSFGRTHFIYSDDQNWPQAAAVLPQQREPRQITHGHLHVVQQKGRTFQDEHPDVPVLLDKGRFLVVDLPADRAQGLAPNTRYRILPMPTSGSIVADVEDDGRPPNPRVVDILEGLARTVFDGALHTLTTGRSRLSTSPDFASAAPWCRSQLTALGYRARVSSFPVPDGGRCANVIATRAGTGRPGARRTVLVCAPLDSVHHRGPTGPAAGAEGDGSGAAGLLTLADLFSQTHFEHDLTFVLFGGEQQGLHGSRHYVAGLSATQRQRILGALTMDMIGTVNADPTRVLLEGALPSQAMINGLARAAHAYTGLRVQTSLHPYAGDHLPFLDAGIPAVLTTEGSATANGAIQSERGSLDRVNSAFALQILTMNAAWLLATARPGLTPPRAQARSTDADPCPYDADRMDSAATPGGGQAVDDPVRLLHLL